MLFSKCGTEQMARTVAALPVGSRITDYISLGVIAKTFPVSKIHSVLAATGTASIRQRDLPAHVVVYYVIALALYILAIPSFFEIKESGGCEIFLKRIGSDFFLKRTPIANLNEAREPESLPFGSHESWGGRWPRRGARTLLLKRPISF
jgi:hypothetical protein